MFGLDLLSLVIGLALGATFPAFFKTVWSAIKQSSVYQSIRNRLGV
jgi:Na+-transporting NADH:ubiquinone oxidoreductase subunit NqrB